MAKNGKIVGVTVATNKGKTSILRSLTDWTVRVIT